MALTHNADGRLMLLLEDWCSPFLHPTPYPRKCRRRRRDAHGTSQLLTQQVGPHRAIRGAAACRRSACWFCI